MGSSQSRFGFGVGDRDGVRSAIWTVIAGKGEAYVLYEHFGHRGKISLHASGRGHWRGGAPVRGIPDFTPTTSVTTSWNVPLPIADVAALIFEVLIPVSQLRLLGPPRSRKPAHWLTNAPPGSTAVFDIYRTPPTTDPSEHPGLPGRHVQSVPMGDGGWLTTVANCVTKDEKYITQLREQMLIQLRALGHEPDAAMRGAGFFEGQNGLRGMVEVALV